MNKNGDFQRLETKEESWKDIQGKKQLFLPVGISHWLRDLEECGFIVANYQLFSLVA
jgi:hypothetical protein